MSVGRRGWLYGFFEQSPLVRQPARRGWTRAISVAALAILIFPALAGSSSGANFGSHAGLAEDTVPDRYFVAGALLADLDHFLPPTEPQTDSETFASGIVERAWEGSHHAWSLARGWLEHIDQDTRFAAAVAAIQASYPSYTATDVRLAFDYWTLTKHPFSTAFDFLLADAEVQGIVAGGLVATDSAGVRDAIYNLLYSADQNAPGLFLQLNASRLYAILYPQVVRNVEPYYDAFYAGAVAGHRDPFPPVDRMLSRLHRMIRNLVPPKRSILEPLVIEARNLARDRPAGWFGSETAALEEIISRSEALAPVVGDVAWQVLDALAPR